MSTEVRMGAGVPDNGISCEVRFGDALDAMHQRVDGVALRRIGGEEGGLSTGKLGNALHVTYSSGVAGKDARIDALKNQIRERVFGYILSQAGRELPNGDRVELDRDVTFLNVVQRDITLTQGGYASIVYVGSDGAEHVAEIDFLDLERDEPDLFRELNALRLETCREVFGEGWSENPDAVRRARVPGDASREVVGAQMPELTRSVLGKYGSAKEFILEVLPLLKARNPGMDVEVCARRITAVEAYRDRMVVRMRKVRDRMKPEYDDLVVNRRNPEAYPLAKEYKLLLKQIEKLEANLMPLFFNMAMEGAVPGGRLQDAERVAEEFMEVLCMLYGDQVTESAGFLGIGVFGGTKRPLRKNELTDADHKFAYEVGSIMLQTQHARIDYSEYVSRYGLSERDVASQQQLLWFNGYDAAEDRDNGHFGAFIFDRLSPMRQRYFMRKCQNIHGEIRTIMNAHPRGAPITTSPVPQVGGANIELKGELDRAAREQREAYIAQVRGECQARLEQIHQELIGAHIGG